MRDEVNAMLTDADEHGTKIQLEDRRDAFLDAYVNTRIREQKFTLENAGEFKLPDNCVCSVTGAVVVQDPCRRILSVPIFLDQLRMGRMFLLGFCRTGLR